MKLQSGSWQESVLASIPHLLLGTLPILVWLFSFFLPGLYVNYRQLIEYVILGIILLLFTGALYKGWREYWPRWTTSWYSYLFVVVGLMFFYSPLFYDVLDRPFLIMIPATAIFCLLVSYYDRVDGLLAGLALFPMFWSMFMLEGVAQTIRDPVYFLISLLTAIAAGLLVRIKRWWVGVLLVLGLSVVVCLLASYIHVYYAFRGPEYPYSSDLQTPVDVLIYFVQQIFVVLVLIVPTSIWTLWERRSSMFLGSNAENSLNN